MNPWRGLKNLPREMWILSAATLVNRSGTMVLAFLVLYVTHTLGVAPARAALALMVYGLAALVSHAAGGNFVRSHRAAADHESVAVSHRLFAAFISAGEKLQRDFADDVCLRGAERIGAAGEPFDGFRFGAACATQSGVRARAASPPIWG